MLIKGADELIQVAYKEGFLALLFVVLLIYVLWIQKTGNKATAPDKNTREERLLQDGRAREQLPAWKNTRGEEQIMAFSRMVCMLDRLNDSVDSVREGSYWY